MADITFLTAGIGGGKSLFAAQMIARELEMTERCIVTNLALHVESAPPGRLTVQQWCHRYIKHKNVDVGSRLRILEPGEVPRFFRCLPGVELPLVKFRRDSEREDFIMIPDLQYRQTLQNEGRIRVGCFYVLDEVHLYFNSRDWQITGSAVEHYMSQLRKLNDDIFLITQHPGKVDKNFRRNSTEWIFLQNMAKKRLFLGVTLSSRFRAHFYMGCEPSRMESPDNTSWFGLRDRECHLIYDTMAGVGLAGRMLPEQSRTKGRHWIVVVFFLVAILFVGYVVPHAFLYGAGRFTSSLLSSFGGGFKPVSHVSVPLHSSSVTIGEDVARNVDMQRNALLDKRRSESIFTHVKQDIITNDVVYLSGVYTVGERTNYILSDGRVVSSETEGYRYSTAREIDIKGTVYRMR